MKNKICTILAVVICILCCACESEDYTTEDVKISGTVTKQYITEIARGRYVETTVYYYTVVDYGGENLKVINDYDYYIHHSVGDEVELTKHRTYDSKGNWIKTEVRWK